MIKNKVLLTILTGVVVFLFAGCSVDEEAVLLRFKPQVGSTYPYQFQITSQLAPISIGSEMKILNRDELGYHLQFTGILNELFSGSLIVTERHNANHPGYFSLNFPDEPVKPGAEWTGQAPWYYENYFVLDETTLYLPTTCKLLRIEQGKNGRLAVIEQRIEAEVAVDGLEFYMGQVGIQWDQDGIITGLVPGYDAYDKLLVGDQIVRINGQSPQAPGKFDTLAETIIQRPKQNQVVTFTVLRDGQTIDVQVEKTVDLFALVKVYNKQDVLNIVYDVDRGILISVELITSYEVAYTSPTADPIQIADSYGGYFKFGYLAGLTTYQERIDSNGAAWTLSLVDE